MTRTVSLLLTLALAAPAAGSELDDLLAMDLEQLMEVEVLSASRTLERQVDAPAAVTVITRQMIDERGYLTLADALRDVPGFDVATGYPAGEYPTHLLFRGQGDVGQSKLLVLIDNIEQNEVSNGWVNQFGWEGHLDDIERIEVIAGPGSTLYGGHAYAGVIHIITTRPTDEVGEDTPVRAQARVVGGTYRTLMPSASLTWRLPDGGALRLSGRFVTSEGDHGLNRADPGNYWTDNAEPLQVNTLEQGVIDNQTDASGNTPALADGFDTHIRDASVRARLETAHLDVGAWWWNRSEGLGSEVVGYEYFANTAGVPYRAHHMGYGLSLRHLAPLSDRTNLRVQASMRGTEIRPDTEFVYTYQYQSVDNGTDPVTEDYTKNYRGSGIELSFDPQLDVRLSETEGWENRLTVGAEAQRRIREYAAIGIGDHAHDGASTIVDRTFPTGEPSVNPVFLSWSGAVYAQDVQELGKHRLIAGLRADFDTATAVSLNPRAGLVLHPSEDWTLKFLYGEAFKAPTVFELRDEWRGNPDLEPQKVRTGEIEQRARLLDGRLFVGSGVWASVAHDLIEIAANPDPSAVPVGPEGQHAEYYQNLGSTAAFGVSGDVRGTPVEGLTVYGNYALTLGEDFGPLDGTATHKVNLGATWNAFDIASLHVGGNIYSRVKAPATNRYYHPVDDAWVADNYAYVTEDDPDGFGPGHVLINTTVRSRSVEIGRVAVSGELLVRNLLDSPILGMGRQAGSGTRPIDQPSVMNPDGFGPAYHPLPGREILVGVRGAFR